MAYRRLDFYHFTILPPCRVYHFTILTFPRPVCRLPFFQFTAKSALKFLAVLPHIPDFSFQPFTILAHTRVSAYLFYHCTALPALTFCAIITTLHPYWIYRFTVLLPLSPPTGRTVLHYLSMNQFIYRPSTIRRINQCGRHRINPCINQWLSQGAVRRMLRMIN